MTTPKRICWIGILLASVTFANIAIVAYLALQRDGNGSDNESLPIQIECVNKEPTEEESSVEKAPALPPDVRDEVMRVVDDGLPYAERNAALRRIDYELNQSEVGALENCIMAEECCARGELHALKNDIMNLLRKRSGDPDGVVIFLCDGADVFLERGDNVMVDYCIQHAA